MFKIQPFLLMGLLILPSHTFAESTSEPAHNMTVRSFFLKKVQLIGNAVIGSEELEPLIKPYKNRQVTLDDVQQLRQDLTAYYLNKGYINSGATLPKQDVNSGELLIEITEGTLTDIKLEGDYRLRDYYLKSHIFPQLGKKALNIKELQENLQLLQQNPNIKRINAQLSPGLQAGQATLRTRIEENRPYYLTLSGNNNGVPAVGAERFEAWAGHRNVLGLSDELSGNFSLSDGQMQYSFDYALPFTRWDTTLNVRYQYSDATVVERPFNSLNIFNQTEGFGLGITQPIYRSLENQVTLSVMAERRHSEAFMMNTPDAFNFSRGSVDGASNISVIRFSQDWLNRTENRVIALRSVLNWGIDTLNATTHSRQEDVADSRAQGYQGTYALPDGHYFFWLGQGQWIQRLWETGIELHLQGNVQISANPLLSLEQYALGGMHSVRGYRKNQAVSDNGFATTLEFRIPVFPSVLGENVLKLAPFLDVGQSWYTEHPTDQSTQTLASAGIGFHLEVWKPLHIEFYWAEPFIDVDNTGRNLQDSGIFFTVNYSPFELE